MESRLQKATREKGIYYALFLVSPLIPLLELRWFLKNKVESLLHELYIRRRAMSIQDSARFYIEHPEDDEDQESWFHRHQMVTGMFAGSALTLAGIAGALWAHNRPNPEPVIYDYVFLPTIQVSATVAEVHSKPYWYSTNPEIVMVDEVGNLTIKILGTVCATGNLEGYVCRAPEK